MVRNHPLRLSTGELLLPCYSESLYTPTFMFSADDFDSQWEECGNDDDPAYLIDHLAQIQPSVIERADGSLLALMRNTASYGNKRAMQMTSLDWGRTWTRGEESVLPNDGASIEMIQLADGRLALAFNNTSSGRYPLSLALSEDEGLTWPIVGDCDGPCEEGGCSHGYPSIAQDPTDQSIWVTFTDERATIGWVHTNEQWVMAQHDTLAPPPAR
jgi:predicted neuraminidase